MPLEEKKQLYLHQAEIHLFGSQRPVHVDNFEALERAVVSKPGSTFAAYHFHDSASAGALELVYYSNGAVGLAQFECPTDNNKLKLLHHRVKKGDKLSQQGVCGFLASHITAKDMRSIVLPVVAMLGMLQDFRHKRVETEIEDQSGWDEHLSTAIRASCVVGAATFLLTNPNLLITKHWMQQFREAYDAQSTESCARKCLAIVCAGISFIQFMPALLCATTQDLRNCQPPLNSTEANAHPRTKKLVDFMFCQPELIMNIVHVMVVYFGVVAAQFFINYVQAEIVERNKLGTPRLSPRGLRGELAQLKTDMGISIQSAKVAAFGPGSERPPMATPVLVFEESVRHWTPSAPLANAQYRDGSSDFGDESLLGSGDTSYGCDV